jgi:hypothetical protein
MYLSVKKVKAIEDYKLLVTFENNENRIFDMSPYLTIGKFAELKDKSLFKSVKISFDSIEWANHMDLDPEFLYQKSKAV